MLKTTYRPTFRMRVRIALIVLITVAIIITGVGSYWIAADIVESNAIKSNQINVHKSKQMLDNNLRQITVSVMTLMISDAFKNVMKDVAMNDDSRYAAHLSSLQPLFAQIKLSEPMTQAILVSTPIGEFYSTGYVRNSDAPFIDSDIHQRLKSEKGLLWSVAHQDPFFSNHERVITFATEPLSDVLVNDVYIIVNVSEESMKESLNINLSEYGGELLLITPDGKEVLQSEEGIWGDIGEDEYFKSLVTSEMDHFQYDIGGEEYIINTAKLENRFGWIVANVQKKSALLKQMDRIKWIVIGVAMLGIVIATILSKVLMAFMLRPMNQLMTLMKKVESNNLSVRFESEQIDEFSRVGQRFNMMLEEINNLITSIKLAEKEKRTAEVKALQAHISPHFLYNTLNTIYFKCELGHNEDIGEMVLALSRMFQLGLNNGNAITTLEKEISHVEQYMLIQQRCYAGKFEYEINVQNDQLHTLPILKVMLQPLVENTILHGFKNMRTGGKIIVDIIEEQDMICLTVTDNGQGMDAPAIMSNIVRDHIDGRSSYALHNIYDRLRLYYGDQSQMKLYSEKQKKTVVSIQIPIQGVTI